MSGHSKWSQIKRTKGVLDQKKGLLFSKFSKKITMAAKEGGGDPGANFKLKTIIDSAKAAGMPNDNVQRAIKNAEGAGAGAIKEVVYEGYGPYGTSFLIEAATDNSNRTFNNIRHIFSEHAGNIGSQGSVAWQFSTKGEILPEYKRTDLTVEQKPKVDALFAALENDEDVIAVHTSANL